MAGGETVGDESNTNVTVVQKHGQLVGFREVRTEAPDGVIPRALSGCQPWFARVVHQRSDS